MNLLHIHKFFATPMSSTSLETKVKHIQDYYEALHTYTLYRLELSCMIYPTNHPSRLQALQDYKLVRTIKWTIYYKHYNHTNLI